MNWYEKPLYQSTFIKKAWHLLIEKLTYFLRHFVLFMAGKPCYSKEIKYIYLFTNNKGNIKEELYLTIPFERTVYLRWKTCQYFSQTSKCFDGGWIMKGSLHIRLRSPWN